VLNLLKSAAHPRAKILFLGYSEKDTDLIAALASHNCEVWHTDEKISSTAGFDLVVSYGYRHILRKDVIESSPAPIVNLHVSYLPWNRGAHPNFWSFFESTPSGVTIHLIDEGIDTGPILFQKEISFAPDEKTFVQTYQRLRHEVELLFKENLVAIVDRSFQVIPQPKSGSCHKVSDLPKEFSGWDVEIAPEIARLRGNLNV